MSDDRPQFGDQMVGAKDAPEGAYVLGATLIKDGGSAGSASGGTKATIKFEVHPEEQAQLVLAGAMESMAFRVTFAKVDLGEGITIAMWNGRRDENGGPRAWLVLNVPEVQQKKLAAIWSKGLHGKSAALVLQQMQTELDEILTKRA